MKLFKYPLLVFVLVAGAVVVVVVSGFRMLKAAIVFGVVLKLLRMAYDSYNPKQVTE